jgi:Fe-S cluster biosynthesis and repair protein YggX
MHAAGVVDDRVWASSLAAIGGVTESGGMMARMVFCAKLKQELPGLDAPPFPGELGERIFENISAEAYRLWGQHATIMINHYGLHPADPETRKMLRKEMEEFFFSAEAAMPEGWADPTQGSKGGSSKGAEAPARKK